MNGGARYSLWICIFIILEAFELLPVALDKETRLLSLLGYQAEPLDPKPLLDVLLALHDVVQMSQCLEVKPPILLDKRVLDDLLCEQLFFLNDRLNLFVEFIDTFGCFAIELTELFPSDCCSTVHLGELGDGTLRVNGADRGLYISDTVDHAFGFI